MPFPVGWPPRVTTGIRNIRVFQAGTATANFDDSAYLFIDVTGANTFSVLPVVQSGDDRSRYPTPAPVAVPPPPTGTGESDLGSPKAMIWSSSILIRNTGGGVLEFSFDGTNVHGSLAASASQVYLGRHEAGIAFRGAGVGFEVEAW